VLASPKGGQPPPDPKSNEPNFQTDLTSRLSADAGAKSRDSREWFASTPFSTARRSEDQTSIKLIETMFSKVLIETLNKIDASQPV
jgi:hypothetical protein